MGIYHHCALTDSGTPLKCWGRGSKGRLGNGERTLGKFNPSQCSAQALANSDNLSGVSQIFLGNHHTCALMDDSSVKCWGDVR